MNPRRRLLWKFTPFYAALFIIALTALLIIAGESTLNVVQSNQTTVPSSAIHWPTTRVLILSLLFSAIIAGVGGGVIWRISQSIEKTREGAKRFADGDLSFRLDIPLSAEFGGLSETLNQMAAQLNERISTINEQRLSLDVILGSMVEGVIAVDENTSILQMNRAASELLSVQSELTIGRRLPEIVRNRELFQLVDQALQEGVQAEGEITLHDPAERSLQVHCSALRNSSGAGIGALVVLNDITRLRRLERVRRDFVANVSHELKTPLTSIKGFVETLQDGALDEPEEARRFCGIIAKQVDRLQAIIEDLLSLSRIEQDAEQEQMPLTQSSLFDMLSTAIQSCAIQASEKNISIQMECYPSWTARFNAPLLEQVAVNLIDNAIKYSDPDRTVEIKVTPTDTCWEIRVIDHGCGIELAHLDRIFERFYRVDKARSRKAGGTGLGLSIVRHIVTAHGGRIQVESKPGAGSCFTVYLPNHPTDNRE